VKVEPLEGIEPSTYALPRRRYTTKPQWRMETTNSLIVNIHFDLAGQRGWDHPAMGVERIPRDS
jgi:hypothetical protein